MWGGGRSHKNMGREPLFQEILWKIWGERPFFQEIPQKYGVGAPFPRRSYGKSGVGATFSRDPIINGLWNPVPEILQ